jgi:hypothetical protein
MSDLVRQVFNPGRDEEHAQGRGHQAFEDGVEMRAVRCVQAGEGLVQD